MMMFRKSLILSVVIIATNQANAILPTPTDSNINNSNKVTFKQHNSTNNTKDNQSTTDFSKPTSNHVDSTKTTNISNPRVQRIATNSEQYANQYAQSHHINKITQAFVVDDVNGQETLIPITLSTTINSGDIIEYQGKFTNNGTNRIRSMMVTLSIPKEMELIGNISPQYALGSNDTQTFNHMPLQATIKGVVQDLPLSYYRALKWKIQDLELDTTTIVKYRAKMK